MISSIAISPHKLEHMIISPHTSESQHGPFPPEGDVAPVDVALWWHASILDRSSRLYVGRVTAMECSVVVAIKAAAGPIIEPAIEAKIRGPL